MTLRQPKHENESRVRQMTEMLHVNLNNRSNRVDLEKAYLGTCSYLIFCSDSSLAYPKAEHEGLPSTLGWP